MEEGAKSKKTVFVGGISEDTDETTLYESFSTFGVFVIHLSMAAFLALVLTQVLSILENRRYHRGPITPTSADPPSTNPSYW
jgi:hypothetical protein